MRILFIWLAVTIRSMASQTCEILHGKARQYYDHNWDRYRTACDDSLPPEIKCNYSEVVNYPDISQLCHQDQLRLRFYSDRISVLPGSAFKTNFKISGLYLKGLGIKKITPGAFNHQSTVEYIYLNKNNLSQIGDGIFNSLIHLEVLDLSENEISNISEDAFSSVPLKQLNVSYNDISSMIGSFAHVQVLDMSHNSIKSIPSKTFATTTLNISSNKIDRINLSYFPNIKKLYIADNAIETINLQNATLTELDLRDNRLTTLPEDLKNLEVLNLAGNKISNLPNFAIVSKNLQKLILSNNSISNIPVLYFTNLKKLETLDLSKNYLSEFTYGTFDALKSLHTLNISYNKFKTLPIPVFHSMNGLRAFYFSHNGLTEVNVDDLGKYLPNVSMVDIRNNALTCHNLLEVCRNLQKRKISFEHGSFTEGNNIYGMNCSGHYDSINTKDKSNNPEINEAYAALLNYFNTEFRNSTFVKYLGNYRNIGNKTENSILLSNLTDILSDIKQHMNEIVKTDRAQANVKRVSNMNQTNIEYVIPHQTLAGYSNIMEGIFKNLKQIVNYANVTDASHDKKLKEISGIGRDIKQELSGIGVDIKQGLSGINLNLKQVLETLREIHGEPESMPHLNHHSEDLEQQQSKGEVAELHSFAENASSKAYNPVLTCIAVLLTIIVGLLLVVLYAIFSRTKHVASSKSDVELAQLVASKPDSVNS